MTARLIDGKAIAQKVRAEVAEAARKLKETRGIVPGLAVVRVGEDPASKVYVGQKYKAAAEVGFNSWEHHMPESSTHEQVLAKVRELNADPSVHGILLQLPVPKQVNSEQILAAIDPRKDADGFHPVNAGNLLLGYSGPRPCTPAGIMRMLDEEKVDLGGKRAVVVGRSNIVGKPMSLLLMAKNATVTMCHSKSNLAEEVPRADVLVVAIGVKELIKGEWIKPGAVVIDVGMNRVDGKLYGDVEFGAAKERASLITPVPGGVGPMTVAMLMHNTLIAAGG